MALAECQIIKIEKVLITCKADNIASAKTIKSCGGVLDNEVLEEGKILQRYWIHLEPVSR